MVRRRASVPRTAIARALASAILLDLPVPNRDPDEAHRVAREVLSRPEFRAAGRPFLARVLDWVLGHLAELIAALIGSAAASVVGLILTLLILGAVAAVAIRFARGLTSDPQVAALVGRGLVEEVPGRTAGEYRGEVRRNAPGAAEAFSGATDPFERAWYGRAPTGADDASHFRDLAGRVLERVRA